MRTHGILKKIATMTGAMLAATVPWPSSSVAQDRIQTPSGPVLVETLASGLEHPSGMAFYTGNAFPAWRGSMLIDSLSDRALVRVMLSGREAAGEERIPLGARIRDVEQEPDGNVYVLTDEDDGKVRRLRPAG